MLLRSKCLFSKGLFILDLKDITNVDRAKKWSGGFWGRGARDGSRLCDRHIVEKTPLFVLLNLFYLFVLVLVRSFFINKVNQPGVDYVARGYVGTGIRLRNSSASSETTPAFLQYKDA